MVAPCFPTSTFVFAVFFRGDWHLARLSPRQVEEGSLLPVRDGLADRVFHSRAEHIPIEELAAADLILLKRPSPRSLILKWWSGREWLPTIFYLGDGRPPSNNLLPLPLPADAKGHGTLPNLPSTPLILPQAPSSLDCRAISYSGATIHLEAYRIDKLQYSFLICTYFSKLVKCLYVGRSSSSHGLLHSKLG